MRRLAGVLGVVAVLVLSMGFAALNGGQRITVRLGVVTLYRVPLTVVVFGSVILGMLVMLVAGIRSDLRVRRILRDRLAREDEEEKARIFVDQTQQDLFDQPPVERAPGEPGRGERAPVERTPRQTSGREPGAAEPPVVPPEPSTAPDEPVPSEGAPSNPREERPPEP